MACSALYRQSKLGLSLVDALDQLVEEGKLPPQLALRILDEVRHDRQRRGERRSLLLARPAGPSTSLAALSRNERPIGAAQSPGVAPQQRLPPLPQAA